MSKTLAELKKEKYTGEYIWTFSNGKKRKQYNFIDGKKHGICIDYYNNNKNTINKKIEYQYDKYHGKYEIYNKKTGYIMQLTNYFNNVPDGEFKLWHDNGKLKEERIYQHGHFNNIGLKTFDKYGVLTYDYDKNRKEYMDNFDRSRFNSNRSRFSSNRIIHGNDIYYECNECNECNE
jgi:antitoxin component YwqK of YwqJK toxin-antitoxin module